MTITTVSAHQTPEGNRSRPPTSRPRGSVAYILFAALILTGVGAGWLVGWDGTKAHFPPLYDRLHPALGWSIVLPLGVIALAVILTLTASRRSWRWVLISAMTISFAWIIVLNIWKGPDVTMIGHNFSTGPDYRSYLDVFTGPLDTLANYTNRHDQLRYHAAAHPPGPIIIEQVLASTLGQNRIALWGLVVSMAAASAVVPLGLVGRRLLGDEPVRMLLPLVALAPYALWASDTMDAVFMAIAAWLVALWFLKRSALASVSAGIGTAVLLLMSYGLAPFWLILLALRRDRRGLLLAAAGCAGTLLAVAALGFWYLDGARLTHTYFYGGWGGSRSHMYWLLGNFAAVALATGPAVARSTQHAIAAPKCRSSWVVFSAIAALAALTVLGVTKGEVERIWLPFMPWILLCAAGTSDRNVLDRFPASALVVAQGVMAIMLSALLSPG